MPTPSKTTKADKSATEAPPAEWPSLVESGAGLSEADGAEHDPMDAPIEKLPPQPFSLKAEVRKHPALYIGLGALAVAGLAAVLGRGALVRAARPMVARAVGPVLVRAAARRPLEAARLAARHPRAAARLVAGLRRG